MPATSRRRLLAATVSLSAAIAGCAGLSESETGSESDVTEARDGGEPFPSDAFDVVTIRSATDDVFVYPSGDPPGDDDRVRSHRRSTEFVLTEAAATELQIDTDNAGEARTFLDATDFDTESVIVEQRSIDDCYRRHLLSVQAAPDEFRTEYCRRLKPATTACESDLTMMKAVFIRVQQAYDDRPSSRTSGERGSCPDSVFEDENDNTTMSRLETTTETGKPVPADEGSDA